MPKNNAMAGVGTNTVRAELVTLFGYFFVFGMVGSSWVVRLPEVRSALHITTAQLGLVLFAGAVGAMTGILLSGRFVAKYGARTGSLVGFNLVFIGYVGQASGVAMENVIVVSLSAVISGLGYGLGDVAINVEGTDMEKRLHRSLMPPLHGAYSIGTLAGAGIGTIALAVGIALPLQIYAVCVLVAVVAWTTIRLLPADTGRVVSVPSETPDRHSPAAWRDPRIIFLGLAILCITITEGAGLDWLTLSMVDDYLTDPVRASIAFAVMMAAMTVVRFAGGIMIDRFGRVGVLRVFALAGIAGLLLIIFSHVYALALFGAALWGAGVALGFPVLLSAAADGDTDGSSRRVSIVASFGYVAFLVGPPTLGFLGQAWGLLNMFFVLVGLLVVFVITSGAARPRKSIA
ncbi:MAG: MFS transporter [Microbacteriaceae bacterium]|nr:MFS transporter [Microbacteriaceae bacterium]